MLKSVIDSIFLKMKSTQVDKTNVLVSILFLFLRIEK